MRNVLMCLLAERLLRPTNEPSDGSGRPGTLATVCPDSSPDRTLQQTRQDGVETVCELDAEVTSSSICGLRLAYNRVSTNVSRERWPMDTRRIGSLEVSVVGLGCNNFGRRLDYDATSAVVDAALDAGITFFDTADEVRQQAGRGAKGREARVCASSRGGQP